nr:MAG TPA: hypothetical protein [Caudoviricetes sp.]
MVVNNERDFLNFRGCLKMSYGWNAYLCCGATLKPV